MTKHSGSQMLSNGYTVDQDRRGRERIAGKNLCTAGFCNYHAKSPHAIQDHIRRPDAVKRWTCDNCDTDYCSSGALDGHDNMCGGHTKRKTTLSSLQTTYPGLACRPIRIDPGLLVPAHPVSTPAAIQTAMNGREQRQGLWRKASEEETGDMAEQAIPASDVGPESLHTDAKAVEQANPACDQVMDDLSVVGPEDVHTDASVVGVPQQPVFAYSSNRLPSMAEAHARIMAQRTMDKVRRAKKLSRRRVQRSAKVLDEDHDTATTTKAPSQDQPTPISDDLIDPDLLEEDCYAAANNRGPRALPAGVSSMSGAEVSDDLTDTTVVTRLALKSSSLAVLSSRTNTASGFGHPSVGVTTSTDSDEDVAKGFVSDRDVGCGAAGGSDETEF